MVFRESLEVMAVGESEGEDTARAQKRRSAENLH